MTLSKIAVKIYGSGERVAREILVIDCGSCGNQSYYDGGFTCGCEHCGASIDQLSDEAYSLEDSWSIEDSP
jgi:hypothetical protein